MMELYRAYHGDPEAWPPVNIVGVHPLRWHEHPYQPTVGLVPLEPDDPENPIVQLQDENAALRAQVAKMREAGDRVAAACEVLARKLNDCTNEDLAEAVAAWTAWRREAKSDG